jgi:hypothetical protein
MIGPLLALVSLSANADLTIAIPAPATDISTNYGTALDSTSANAKQIKSLCGASYYKGSASSAGLTETTAGELSLQYSLVYADADGAYGTAAGILLPLDPAWDIKDLSKSTAITFQIKAATAGVTTHLIIGTSATATQGGYPADVSAVNGALTSPASVALTTAYTTVSINPNLDLTMPTWVSTNDVSYNGEVGWIADGTTTTISIAKVVQELNIQPILDAAWNSTGTAFLTTAAAKAATANTITIRNVSIVGASEPPQPAGSSCTGTNFVTLDDFAATNAAGPNIGLARKASDPNYFGGYWYAFTDTDNILADNNQAPGDTSLGKSRIILPSGTSAWTPIVGQGAFLTAQLEKNDTGSSFLYHKYAGWADIGTRLPGHNPDGSLNLQNTPGGGGLTGIAFDIYGGSAAASLIPGATFDTDNVVRVIFKVGRASVNDAESFQVSIPLDQVIDQGNGTQNLCVDATALQQPSWYTPAATWSANDLTKLSWEIRIEDQSNPAIHATSVPSTFGIANVRFYGVTQADLASGIKATRTPASALRATYTGVLQLSYAVDGTSAQIDVRSLDGARIASFLEAASSQNLSLPVVLSRGTYLVSVQGSRSRQVALLSVVR